MSFFLVSGDFFFGGSKAANRLLLVPTDDPHRLPPSKSGSSQALSVSSSSSLLLSPKKVSKPCSFVRLESFLVVLVSFESASFELLAFDDVVAACDCDCVAQALYCSRMSMDLSRSVLFSDFSSVESGFEFHSGQIGIQYSSRRYSSSVVASQLRQHSLIVGSGLQCAPLAHHTLGTHAFGLVRISVGIGQSDDEIDAATDRLVSTLVGEL